LPARLSRAGEPLDRFELSAWRDTRITGDLDLTTTHWADGVQPKWRRDFVAQLTCCDRISRGVSGSPYRAPELPFRAPATRLPLDKPVTGESRCFCAGRSEVADGNPA